MVTDMTYPPDFTTLGAFDSQNAWVASRYGAPLVRTTDGRATWQAESTGANVSLNALRMFDSDHGWIAGGKATVLFPARPLIARTTTGGQSWTTLAPDRRGALSDVVFSDLLNGWVVGHQGQAFRTADGGMTWERLDTGVTQNLLAVRFGDGNTGWAAGAGGTVLKTASGGDVWAVQDSGTSEELRGLVCRGPGKAWAVGKAGVVLRTTPAGDTAAPSLAVATPPAGQAVTPCSYPVTVSGQASDVSGVRVKVGPFYVLPTKGTFSVPVYLTQGAREFRVQAVDKAGNVTETAVPLSVDLGIPARSTAYSLCSLVSGEDYLTRNPCTVTSQTTSDVGNWYAEFTSELDGYLSGGEFGFALVAGSYDAPATCEVEWFAEREGRSERLAGTAFPVHTDGYYVLSQGSAWADPGVVVLKGQRLRFRVSFSGPGAMAWGGPYPSTLSLPVGLTLVPGGVYLSPFCSRRASTLGSLPRKRR